jgi:hypothetical protein
MFRDIGTDLGISLRRREMSGANGVRGSYCWSESGWRRIFPLIAVAAALAALWHMAGILGLNHHTRFPPWRHAIFVAVDLGAAWYLLHRPRWGLPLFILLAVQQSISHGSSLFRHWRAGQPDWMSLVVLAIIYATLGLLMVDNRYRTASVGSRRRIPSRLSEHGRSRPNEKPAAP